MSVGERLVGSRAGLVLGDRISLRFRRYTMGVWWVWGASLSLSDRRREEAWDCERIGLRFRRYIIVRSIARKRNTQVWVFF